MPNYNDPENMFDAIWNFSENIEDAFSIGENISLKNHYKNIDHIIISGMGGSAIGGDFVSALESKSLSIPLTVLRGYSLPFWINKNTLVICSSYSGNTEETLSVLDHAKRKNLKICGITTGGALAQRLKEMGKDIVIIPKGLQPRAAIAYSFIPMIALLEKIGVLSSDFRNKTPDILKLLKEKRKIYSTGMIDNPVFRLSKLIKNRIPVIYSDSSTMRIAANRLKGQLAENSKMLSWNNELPELNHNEIVGWENNAKLFSNLYIIWLKDIDDHKRVKLRMEISSEILKNLKIEQYELLMDGNSFQERFLHMIHYGDWLSFWCAILHNTDPSPVEKIHILKQELSTRL